MSFFKNLFQSKSTPTRARKIPPPGRFASAYKFADRIVLHSRARLPGWTLIACEPYLTLAQDAVAEDLGRAVLTALAGFRPDMPDPTDFKQVTADFVRGVGAKSHKQLQESSISCGIAEREGRLEFQAHHNGGTSGDAKGFQPIPGAQFSVAVNSSVTEIGTALMRCLSQCTTIYDPVS